MSVVVSRDQELFSSKMPKLSTVLCVYIPNYSVCSLKHATICVQLTVGKCLKEANGNGI